MENITPLERSCQRQGLNGSEVKCGGWLGFYTCGGGTCPTCGDKSMLQRIDSDCVLEGMRAVKAACHVLLLGEGKALHILRYHDVRKYVRKLMVD